MYEFLKEIAVDNDWVFEYSRTDYQNLTNDIENDKIYFFVDPIIIDSKFSDSGTESKTYSGRIMILVSSDVDEDYNYKYENHIKPLIENTSGIIKNNFSCSDFELMKFQTTEVINLFDSNLDGILINYAASNPYE